MLFFWKLANKVSPIDKDLKQTCYSFIEGANNKLYKVTGKKKLLGMLVNQPVCIKVESMVTIGVSVTHNHNDVINTGDLDCSLMNNHKTKESRFGLSSNWKGKHIYMTSLFKYLLEIKKHADS